MRRVPVTFAGLKTSRAGLAVRRLTKHPDERIAEQATELLQSWRAAAKDRMERINVRAHLIADAGRADPNEHPFDRLQRRLRGPLPLRGIYDNLAWEYNDSEGFASTRKRTLHKGDKSASGPVLYWMQRDQRVRDNWALIHAQRRALKRGNSLAVVFCLPPSYGHATVRQLGFMLRGLRHIEQDLRELGIPFRLLLGDPVEQLAAYAQSVGASAIVADVSPLRTEQEWKSSLVSELRAHTPAVAVEEVDAHNVVPVWIASDGAESQVRSHRSRVRASLASYMTDFPKLVYLPSSNALEDGHVSRAQGAHEAGVAPSDPDTGLVDWPTAARALHIDWSVPEVAWVRPGERAAEEMLALFLAEKVDRYDRLRSDPTRPKATSNLSPFLHFGHIAAQRVILEMVRVLDIGLEDLFVSKPTSGPQVFADEVVVHKELADNFCFYTPSYDSVEGSAPWALESLEAHARDAREYTYTRREFEAGKTHDPLWNAAHMELLHKGKMHGFMRSYWAKKILEWTQSPQEALATAVYLNDRYALDGSDPMGYTGILSAIGGVHDLGGKERAVYGKVRALTAAGCEKKFNVKQYQRDNKPVPLPPFPPQPPRRAEAESHSGREDETGHDAPNEPIREQAPTESTELQYSESLDNAPQEEHGHAAMEDDAV